MTDDSLKVHENEDGSFSIEWDREDSKWNWLNDLTSKEIVKIIEDALEKDLLIE
tara:strand:- start:615 stop:776 length:162 start_codon:yes stop_codon:yes gene_type:complete